VGRVLFAVIVMCCSVAHADRLVIVGGDRELVLALQDLTFDVSEEPERETPPLDELADVSRGLSDRHGAGATVWLRGTTLVTYDRASDRYIVRTIPYTHPLGVTQAAEIARMVRVMLRAAREGGPAAPAGGPRAISTPPPGIARAEREPIASVMAGGGGWFAAPDADVLPALAVAVAWRPHGVGAAVTAMLAPRTTLSTLTFAGTVRAWSASAEARYAIRLASRAWVTPSAGVALHTITVRGEMLDDRRLDPALRAGASMTVGIAAGVTVGVDVGVDVLMRRQRYESETEQILVVPRVQAHGTLLVGFEL